MKAFNRWLEETPINLTTPICGGYTSDDIIIMAEISWKAALEWVLDLNFEPDYISTQHDIINAELSSSGIDCGKTGGWLPPFIVDHEKK